MTMTNAQLRVEFERAIHNEVTDDTIIDQYLTMGQMRIVRDCPGTLGTKGGSITTADGTQEYSLAADFYQMRGMWFAAGNRRVTPMYSTEWIYGVETRSTLTKGEPERYIITHWELDDTWKARIYPTPDAVYTINYFYWWQPAAVSGATLSPISEIGFEELLLWASIISFRQHNDPDGAIDAKQEYDRLLDDYKKYRPQEPDQIRVLRDTWGTTMGGSTLRMPPEFPVI